MATLLRCFSPHNSVKNYMKNKREWYDIHVGKVISTFSDTRNIVQHGNWGKT